MLWNERDRAIVIACILALAGCGPRSAPAAKTGAVVRGQSVVGQWFVVAINGKPITEGSSINLDYRPDGQLIVEATGADAPPLDKQQLKAALDQMNIAGMTLFTMKVNVGGIEVEMNRKPTTTTVPPG